MGNEYQAKLAELDALIEQQKARLAAMPVAGGIGGDELKAILASQREAQTALVEATRTVRHSNPDHLHISAFSYPEGDLARPKPKLRFKEVYHNGHLEREDDLTPAEIDAYNAITQSCEARNGRWTAEIGRGGKRLTVVVPAYTLDDRMDVPSLTLQLRELAEGERSVNPDNMAAELMLLRKAVVAAGIVVTG